MSLAKSLIVLSIEKYNENPDDLQNMVVWFNAYVHVLYYLEANHGKLANEQEIMMINKMLQRYALELQSIEKHKMFEFIKKNIDIKQKVLHDFLELKEIKESRVLVDDVDNVIMRKVRGCVAVIVPAM